MLAYFNIFDEICIYVVHLGDSFFVNVAVLLKNNGIHNFVNNNSLTNKFRQQVLRRLLDYV